MSNSNFDDFLEIFITISNLDILCFVKHKTHPPLFLKNKSNFFTERGGSSQSLDWSIGHADLGPAWVSHSKKSHI